MQFHASSYAGAATQWTKSSPMIPLQILPFYKKVIQSTALLTTPLQGHCHSTHCVGSADTSSVTRAASLQLQNTVHLLYYKETRSHWQHLEVSWKDGNRDLGIVEDLAHFSSINQTMLIIPLHLPKAKVTLMRQTLLFLFQSSFIPPATRTELTDSLSDLLLVNSSWKSTERLIYFHWVLNFPILPIKQGMPGGISPKEHTFSS